MSKLDGIKAGDRVKIVMEGVMGVKAEHDDKKLRVTLDGGCYSFGLWSGEIDAPTFQITRIESAFKVGDEVVQFGFDQKNTVVAILKDGRLVVEYKTGDSTNVVAREPSCFTHA